MRYKPEQVRNLVEITEETLRHWRKVLSPIKNRKGYQPCFTAGDILALRVVREFVDVLKADVSLLAPIAEDLFVICGSGNWSQLERSWLMFVPSEKRIELKDISDEMDPKRLAVALPLDRLIVELHERLMADDDTPMQGLLRFPPYSVDGRTR